MKIVPLRTGAQMPMIGLGTWKLVGQEAFDATRSALQCGYRHIDCAPIYGNECDVGRAFAATIKSGMIQRAQLWVTSKLWNDCHRPEHVRPALEKTLADLELNYLDLYLMHWPVAHEHGVLRPENGKGFLSLSDAPLVDTWMAMVEARNRGLCRAVGVSNFSVKKIAQLIDATGEVPAVDQVECHPLLQQPTLMDYCRANQIVMTAYSPLGSADRPDAMKRVDEPALLQHPLIDAISKRLDINPAQVLIAWGVARGTPVIPKSANPKRQRENLAAADIELAADDLRAIDQLDRGYRFVDGTFWEQPGGPYTVTDLWDEA